MGFASAYLSGRTVFPQLIQERPDPGTGLIIVIPAYNEPQVTDVLDSLSECTPPGCGIEVIIVVNSPLLASPCERELQKVTIGNILSWKYDHPGSFFRLHAIDSTELEPVDWAVGLARKTGMDEAVRRFDQVGKPDGVIVSLDADCRVEAGYLAEICNQLYKINGRSGCSVYFEHPLKGEAFPDNYYSAITRYELHLRYYFQGLSFTGFPWVHHTVGSAIAVKALAYVKAGGMNRRKAGEDFYFVQKLVQGGGYFNLNTTAVYPSPRASGRVPFGTGATIGRLTGIRGEVMLTYNIEAFRDLKRLFSLVSQELLYNSADETCLHASLPESVRSFISGEEWSRRIREIRMNTSGEKSFAKRFYSWFNMFMIVKYMNSVHRGFYKKLPVGEAASELLAEIGHKSELKDPSDLLEQFRGLERAF
jgi:hypothetical protein